MVRQISWRQTERAAAKNREDRRAHRATDVNTATIVTGGHQKVSDVRFAGLSPRHSTDSPDRALYNVTKKTSVLVTYSRVTCHCFRAIEIMAENIETFVIYARRKK